MVCYLRVDVATLRLLSTTCILVMLASWAVGHWTPGYTPPPDPTEPTGHCASYPCWSGGTCVNGFTGYTCNCPPGTVGQNCETVYNNKCYRLSRYARSHKDASAACVSMGGQLADVKGPSDQQLMAGYIQRTNDVSHWTFIKSQSPQLLHIDGSTLSVQSTWMTRDVYGPFDICVLLDREHGYKGDFHACTEWHNYICESPVVPCQSNVCQNAGLCTSCFSGSAMCDCLPGYTGVFCETDIDECASNPCQNGGTCIDGINVFTCRCRRGFNGVLCENDINYCDPNPCPFDWVCQDEVVGFHCEVPDEARASSALCKEHSCGSGFTCVDAGRTKYYCVLV